MSGINASLHFCKNQLKNQNRRMPFNRLRPFYKQFRLPKTYGSIILPKSLPALAFLRIQKGQPALFFVTGKNPLSHNQIAYDLHRTRKNPGNRIGKIQHIQRMITLENRADPQNPEQTDPHQRYDRRHNGAADSSDASRHCIHNAAKRIRKHHYGKSFHSKGDHLRVRRIKSKNFSAEEISCTA